LRPFFLPFDASALHPRSAMAFFSISNKISPKKPVVTSALPKKIDAPNDSQLTRLGFQKFSQFSFQTKVAVYLTDVEMSS